VGAAAASVAAPAIDELQGEFKSALKGAGLGDDAAQLIASLAGGATAATIGGATAGTTGAATAFNADMNNRQLHPSERKLAQELAKKSGGRYTAEEIENALRSAGNTQTGESIVAGMVVDPKSRDAIYDKGAVWTVGENGTLVQVLPPAPDAALAAYIRQNTGQTYGWYAPSSTNATSGPSAPRDRLTNQPLDEKGRYTQTVVLDGQMYQPKYLPCATAECLRTASNLDMSDPQTRAYVKALDEQVFKDIGTGATVGALVTPVGVGGAGLSGVGLLAVIGTVAVSDAPVGALRDEVIKETLESGAERFFRTVLGHTPATAARVAALINLAGGWDVFAERVKTDLFGVKVDESKK
jgi:filamentous hemagglutinin